MFVASACVPARFGQESDGEHEFGKAGAVYTCLKELVLANRIRPFQRLGASEIAVRLKVSVTPVREALQRLSVERLIAQKVYYGYYVRGLNADEQEQLCRFASLLITHAARAAAIPADPYSFWMTALPAGWETSAVMPTHFVEGVYKTMVGLTGNVELCRVMDNIIDRTHIVRDMDIKHPDSAAMVMTDMRNVIFALLARDADLVVTNLTEQFRRQISRLCGLVREANTQARLMDWP